MGRARGVHRGAHGGVFGRVDAGVEGFIVFPTQGSLFGGYASCYKICKQILNPRKIKALFFIPSSFIGLKGNKSFNFCQKNFYPSRKINQEYKGQFDALTIKQINEIIDSGHYIGAHTINHPILSSLNSNKIEEEINLSVDLIESKINNHIPFFAFPFGSLDTVNFESYKIAKKRFKYCFSNIRGGLSESPSKHFLYRQNLVPNMPIYIVNAILQGKMDLKYTFVRNKAKKIYPI